MSSYENTARRRGRTLLVVEGKHEKNELFWLLFKCFLEMNIDTDSVWVYGTNIYMLYKDIIKEYETDDWGEEGVDIDLPFVISKKKHLNPLCYKADFTNVILVFDYERHDPFFSEVKIRKMQEYFNDETDMGKLYINYPMLESYQDLKCLPDSGYSERTESVSMSRGQEYKDRVKGYTEINDELLKFPHRVRDLLKNHWGVQDEELLDNCYNAVLNVSDIKSMDDNLSNVLSDAIAQGNKAMMAKFQLMDWIKKRKYVYDGKTYWQYMRGIFKQIILHNICKANKILGGQYDIAEGKYKEQLDHIDMLRILDKQNEASRDNERGYIWVLNTCVLFVAEYNYSLIEG